MPYKRIGLAAALFLTALYLRFLMPPVYENLCPVVAAALEAEQVRVPLPPSLTLWLDWE